MFERFFNFFGTNWSDGERPYSGYDVDILPKNISPWDPEFCDDKRHLEVSDNPDTDISHIHGQ